MEYKEIWEAVICEIDNQMPKTIKAFENNILSDKNFLKNLNEKIFDLIKKYSNLDNTSLIMQLCEKAKKDSDKIKWEQVDNMVHIYMVFISSLYLSCLFQEYLIVADEDKNNDIYVLNDISVLFSWAGGWISIKPYDHNDTKEIIKNKDCEIKTALKDTCFTDALLELNKINREMYNLPSIEMFDKIQMLPYVLTALAFITYAVTSKNKLYILIINELTKSSKAEENKLLEDICFHIADFFNTLNQNKSFKLSMYFYYRLLENAASSHNLGKETVKKILYIYYKYLKEENNKEKSESYNNYKNVLKDIISARIKGKKEFIHFLKTKDYKEAVKKCIDETAKCSMSKRFNRIKNEKTFISKEEYRGLCFLNTLLSDEEISDFNEFDKYYASVYNQYIPVYEIAKYIYESSKEMQKKNIIKFLYSSISMFNKMQKKDIDNV